MAQDKTLRDIMTAPPLVLGHDETATTAARRMKEKDIGDVLVMRDGELCGIVTDRDLVVRCIAEGKDPGNTQLEQLCSHDVATLAPDAGVDEAIALMRDKAVRRIPVIDGKEPVGIVSLGDLAVDRDGQSVLGRISAAPPNR